MLSNIAQVALKFIVTFVLSLIFGIERQGSHKPIGFGTFVFVAVGSCALSIAAISLSPENPLPLLGAIVTGIGFLGAGALIRTNDKIFGFTNASSIWLFAIIGVLIGVGEYILGIIIYFLAWMVIIVDIYFEKKGIGTYQRKLIIVTNRIINEKEIRTELMKGIKNRLFDIDINKRDNQMKITFLIEGNKESINKIPNELFKKEWLDSCKVE